MQSIASRRYELDDLETGRVYIASDILKRLDDGRFIIELTTNGHPDDHDHCDVLGDERAAFGWLAKMPEQITRHSIDGGKSRSLCGGSPPLTHK